MWTKLVHLDLIRATILLLIHLIVSHPVYAGDTPTGDPEFTDVIQNVTVPAGRNVKLSCSVNNLGNFKVAWMHFEQSAILTVANHVITRNPRISVSHDKHKTWFLHISNIQEEDKGRYMCQINTVTAKTTYGYLHVVVPPNIDDSLSSSDVIVREGANVTLSCHASGSPPPVIKWKRDDVAKINVNKTHAVSEFEGSTLEMTRISRLDMGAYLCIASNNVPPTVSKRIKVSVDFPPMLWIPHQLVGVPLGFNVTLECHTEAHPTSLNYWTRDDGNMIHESRKYVTETSVGTPSYKVHMKITIFNVVEKDFGTYKCVAKNPRGETDGTIRLYNPTLDTADKSSDLNNSIFDGSDNSLNSKGGKVIDNILNELDKSERKISNDVKSNFIPGWNKPKNGSISSNQHSVLLSTLLLWLLYSLYT
uniref:Neurotrimin n=1 Tax=Cacopsylla melanoneura TaxID=428564 RepID=A0A8D9AQU8_9HEMI